MGNTCVGPSLSKNGFFHTVSAGLWGGSQREEDASVPPTPKPKAAGTGTAHDHQNEDVEASVYFDHKPPEPVKIIVIEQPQPPPPPSKQQQQQQQQQQAQSAPPVPPKPSAAKKVAVAQGQHKRTGSAGLQANSVLKRPTENLKDIYTLGRKLGQDLKPENFLFVSHKEEALLKTIDFGLSIFFRPGDTFTDVVGSPYYVAPEVLRKKYGPEADVWSAGVIIYILLSGVPPFWAENEQGIFEQILNGSLDFESDPWPSISVSAKDLVRKMLVRDPKKRLTAHEVLCHPWIQVGSTAPDKPLDSAVLSRLKQFSAMNKLKKMALRIIAENLSEEEIAGLKEMFKMIDTDNSGQITFEELKAGMERVGANLKESEIYALMQAADVDNSGTIDYGEFVAATLHLNKVEREDHLYAAFSYFDKDGSGYITQDELQQACDEFGLENVRLEEMIGEVDQDNDGRIDYSEFVAMMQKGNVGFGKKIFQNNLSNRKH
ncbi:hypothetical protein J5N97_009990 [Dioscorea zingiberensis]|uniref:non-specific serine/threonine protein kinase n=1 Tax=Dioscorea zingiberensis TaxID=325984 RepID=A0A9D5HM32_9LILI|nr:hypothetical protein J5N97_009990 [Dioscorea zingiberensis]